MKIIDCEQGSGLWIEARLGLPTASDFHKILTPTGKLSEQARKYAFNLIAETVLKRQMNPLEGLEWIERGKELESDAVKLYEFENEVETTVVGFCTNEEGTIGCSPDRLVGEDGLLEIKCPAPNTHIGYMIDGIEKKYIPQKQGQLYITGRKWTDLFSYHPELPPVRIRTERDENYIALLDKSLQEFVAMKAEMLVRIREKGFFAEREKITTAVDMAYRESINQGENE